MTAEEIFSHIAKHMIEGLMVHSKLADFYGFIGFKGYEKCHEYHFYSENINYRKLNNYFLHHCGKVIVDSRFDVPDIIPSTWLQHNRADVGEETRKTSLQVGIEKWVVWEQNTKKLYQDMYEELININDIASALFIKEFIIDVDNELADAEQLWIEKRAMNYSINDIMMEQEDLYKKYSKKIKEIEIC